MQKRKTLFQWIWHSYARTAMVPLIVIELVFLGIYFISNEWIKDKNQKANYNEAKDYLQNLVGFEAGEIQQQLLGVSYLTDSYRKQTAAFLTQDVLPLTQEDKNRLAYGEDGVYYTTKDRSDGGAAVFYSGYVPIGEAERQKVAKLLPMQSLMKDIKDSHPLVASLYFNSYDSLNLIYPYFNVLEQYPPKMDIPSYNFYYEADTAHNPEKKVKWTDVYLDPAGHGWMASSIAPVYKGDKLEGVVGLDITVDTIIKNILNLSIPWEGYALLIGRDGTIIALPSKGEEEWNLQELTTHQYDEAVTGDTSKPDEFNVYKRKDTEAFSSNLQEKTKGVQSITFSGKKQVMSWSTIPETDWKLMVMVEEKEIYREVNAFNQALNGVGKWMSIGLILFYVLFFAWLYRRAKAMSLQIAEPLFFINTGLRRITKGDYSAKQPELNPNLYEVKELGQTALHLNLLSEELDRTRSNLLHANEEIQQRENYLQSLVNSIDDMIFEIDLPGNIVNLLIQDERQLPLPIEQLVGKNITDLLEPDVAEAMFELSANIMKYKVSEIVEFYLPLTNRWYQARVAPILNDNASKLQTFSAVIRDITERKNAEIRLLESEARKSAILDAALDGVVIMDANGTVLEFNPAAEQIFKCKREDAIGHPMIEIMIPMRYREAHTAGMRRYLVEGISTILGKRIEVTAARIDGSEFPMELSVIRINMDGPPVFTAYVRDITQAKQDEQYLIQAKEEAEQASRAKTKFLSQMSHELRTPLNAILGFAQILDFDPIDPLTETQKESVDEIQNAGNHLLTLINEILDLSRIEAGSLPICLEAVSISDVLEDCLSLITPLAAARGITIHNQAATVQAFVFADRTRVKQVILNLLSNAVKYNRDHGEIHLSCTIEQNSLVKLAIRDTGYGMAQSELERIFEPFHRNTNADRFVEGSGIGLTVSKQMAELMNGYIEVDSVEGTGSVFSVVLPLANMAVAQQEAAITLFMDDLE